MATDTWLGSNGAWTTAANWSAGVPTTTTDAVIPSGDPQVTAPISIASLTNAASAAVTFADAGSSAISGVLNNYGALYFDAAHAQGGSNLTVGGILTNTGVFEVGDSDASLTASDTIKVLGIVNSIGEIDLYGGATASTNVLLDATAGAAGFGTAGVVSGDVSLFGHAQIEFQSGQIVSIASGGSLTLSGASTSIFDAANPATNSALHSLGFVAGTLQIENGAQVTTTGALLNINTIGVNDGASLTIGTAFTNYGTFTLDSGGGGSTVVVKGALTNNNDMTLGGYLTQSSIMTVNSLINNGYLSLYSRLPTAYLMELHVATGAAGFGLAGTLTGTVNVSGNSEILFASGQISTIANSASLHLYGATARISDAATPNSNSALTGLNHVSGTLGLEDGALTTSGAMTIDTSAGIYVDDQNAFGGDGGSNLAIAGAVTNNGTFAVGSQSLTGSDQASVQTIVNHGALRVQGSSVAPEAALLNVTGGLAGFGTAGAVTGSVTVSGDASIKFAGGKIATIQSGASLTLNGASATIVDANATSALAGLTSVAGTLSLLAGASFTTTSALSDTSAIYVDNTGTGGSKLTVGGILTNSAQLYVGNNTMSQASTFTATGLVNSGSIYVNGGPAASAKALLNVTAGVAGFGTAATVRGTVNLSGAASIQFASGAITTIQQGGSLVLNGAGASISDVGGASALSGLTSVAGVLQLNNGASIASGALTNSGTTELDFGYYSYIADLGGAQLTVAGTLTNTGIFDLGAAAIAQTDTVTATGIVNKGQLDLVGGASTAATALLNITGGVAGFGTSAAVSGTVTLSGYSEIEFASGKITTILSGATLTLNGADALIEDVGATSALTGLTSIAGTLSESGGASVTTSGPLTITGTAELDYSYYSSTGGSALSVGGLLTNSGTLYMGSTGMTQAVNVIATGLSNKGTLSLAGASATARSLLHVTAGAAGFGTAAELTGSVSLTGSAAIEFASGQITSIQSSSSLTLNGAGAVIEDGATNTNSALSGLATLNGSLVIDNGASIATSGALTSNSDLELDYYYDAGGSSLKVGGLLTNNSDMYIGSSDLTSADTVTATALTNNSVLELFGSAAASGELAVSGSVINNSEVVLSNDSEVLAGAVTGTGTFYEETGSTLELDGSVGNGQTIYFSGADQLILGHATTFAAGLISDFAADDSVTVKGFGTGTTEAFSAGIMTLTDGANVAHLDFGSSYTSSEFKVAVGTANTAITFV